MYCFNCGNWIEEDDLFCGKCGAELQSAAQVKTDKTKKKSPAWIPIVALVLVVSIIAAIVLPVYFSRTELVYVLTSVTEEYYNGAEATVSFSYDRFGNPSKCWCLDGTVCEAEYDRRGNITAMYVGDSYGYEIEYTYEDNNIESCVISECNDKEEQTQLEFEWDDYGNLIRVERSDQPEYNGIYTPLWEQYEYDKDNCLIVEYLCLAQYDGYGYNPERKGCRIFRTKIDYDRNGYVSSVEVADVYTQEIDCRDEDPEDFTYVREFKWVFTYDEDGRILKREEYRGRSTKADEDEYGYDRRGNLLSVGGRELKYQYDRHGNVIDDGDDLKFTYKPVRMTHEAAERYRRWQKLSVQYDLYNYYGMESMNGRTLVRDAVSSCYYYLIPNPVW